MGMKFKVSMKIVILEFSSGSLSVSSSYLSFPHGKYQNKEGVSSLMQYDGHGVGKRIVGTSHSTDDACYCWHNRSLPFSVVVLCAQLQGVCRSARDFTSTGWAGFFFWRDAEALSVAWLPPGACVSLPRLEMTGLDLDVRQLCNPLLEKWFLLDLIHSQYFRLKWTFVSVILLTF